MTSSLLVLELYRELPVIVLFFFINEALLITDHIHTQIS